MKTKSRNRSFSVLSKLWLIVLFSGFIFLESCQVEEPELFLSEVFCDIDTTKLDADKKKFEIESNNEIIKVNVGGYIVENESYSGKYSILLTGKRKFGLSLKFENQLGIEHYLISVWRKDPSSKAALVAQGDKTRSLYIAQTEVVEKGKNGWERLEIDLEVPPNITSVSIYMWLINADSAYFDDFSVKQLHTKQFPVYTDLPNLHLYFTDRKMQKFQDKRMNAFDAGVLIGDGEWMKGIVSNESDVMPIKARFKGDWLDHLMGSKWSFRVKMRDDFTFNRMRVFSLQNPITRYYLNEYYAHQLFDQEGVLATRYGFVPVHLNGKSLGIYAWEEHFAKQLVEYNMRREGPIMKIDEDPLWHSRQYLGEKIKWPNMPYYESARVMAFGMNKILEKPNLKAQFNIAHSLMRQYIMRKAPIEEMFNIDILAKYYALIDVTNGRHGVAWHNQRMYYNPVLCKLEPINFDDFTDYFKEEKRALVSPLLVRTEHTSEAEHNLVRSIFSAPAFIEAYIPYLEKYSDEAFLRKFMDSQRSDIAKYEAMIKKEVPEYAFNENYFYRNASDVRNKIPELKIKFDTGYYDQISLNDATKIADTSFFPQLIETYLNSYYYATDDMSAHLLIENYNGRSVEVVGLADESNSMIHLFNNSVVLKPYEHHYDDTLISVKYLAEARKLVFKDINHDEVFYSELSRFVKNEELSPYQKLKHSFDLNACNLFVKRGDSLFVKSGKYELDKKVLIPAELVLVFEKGVEIDIIKEACIVSHSPVIMNGTKEMPIKIYSSDTTANAFTVLQANGKSTLNHVIFKDLNTLDYEGWTLTGAVNFYESDVFVSNCSFEDNHCEDALNIIRSDFHVTKSLFKNIFADAFDSDFCTGLLDYSKFEFVGNDAIDFSTSQIIIDNCEIINIDDKGVSGGEGSSLVVTNTNIINCNIGVATKDLSVLELENVNIENCNYGLVALRKKPEYGPATLITKKLKLTNCDTRYLIEKESVLQLNGSKILGTIENVADMFY